MILESSKRMKRLISVVISVCGLITPALAWTTIDVMDHPSAFSPLWANAALRAYSCSAEQHTGELSIVEFDRPLVFFPRFEGNPQENSKIASLTLPTDTLILSEGWATEISNVAGRSLFGKSEDGPGYFKVGKQPDAKPNPSGKIDLETERLLEGSEVQVRGVSLDKKSGKLAALISQNQAEAPEPPRYEDYKDIYACKLVENHDLKGFADKTVLKLIASMTTIRKETPSRPVAPSPSKPEPVPALPDRSPSFNPAPDFEKPDAFAAETSKKVKFSLHCIDKDGETIRVAFFEEQLSGFPHLVIKHNENELRASNHYSFERLRVTVNVAPIPDDEKDKYSALLILDGRAGDEIYPAGLMFMANMTASDSQYEMSEHPVQLRSSGELPTAMWPKISNQVNEFGLNLIRFRIDRATGETAIALSWPMMPELTIQHKCSISDAPKRDASAMIRESLTAMGAEQKRLEKSGIENRL